MTTLTEACALGASFLAEARASEDGSRAVGVLSAHAARTAAVRRGKADVLRKADRLQRMVDMVLGR